MPNNNNRIKLHLDDQAAFEEKIMKGPISIGGLDISTIYREVDGEPMAILSFPTLSNENDKTVIIAKVLVSVQNLLRACKQIEEMHTVTHDMVIREN